MDPTPPCDTTPVPFDPVPPRRPRCFSKPGFRWTRADFRETAEYLRSLGRDALKLKMSLEELCGRICGTWCPAADRPLEARDIETRPADTLIRALERIVRGFDSKVMRFERWLATFNSLRYWNYPEGRPRCFNRPPSKWRRKDRVEAARALQQNLPYLTCLIVSRWLAEGHVDLKRNAAQDFIGLVCGAGCKPIRRYRPARGAVENYLTRATKNHATKDREKRERIDGHEGSDGEIDIEIFPAPDEVSGADRERLLAFAIYLACCKDAAKRGILWHVRDHVTHAVIAAEQGEEEGRVRQRFSRTRRAFLAQYRSRRLLRQMNKAGLDDDEAETMIAFHVSGFSAEEMAHIEGLEGGEDEMFARLCTIHRKLRRAGLKIVNPPLCVPVRERR